MKIFKDTDECIGYSRLAIGQTAYLKQIIKEKDFINWKKILNQKPDFEEYITGSQQALNLLNTSVIAGHYISGAHTPIALHCLNLIKKLDLFLGDFPKLLSDKSFIQKLKNLEGFSFLSTLTELSVASYFSSTGLSIAFEKKFIKTQDGHKKDIDITIIDNSGNELNIEVYMPVASFETDGFFDPSDGDHHFSYKVYKKFDDKFGQQGISGLAGKIFLAINYAFFDSIYVKSLIPIGNNDTVFNTLKSLIPNGIDGVLIFTDNMQGANSFVFDKLLMPN